MTAQIIVGHVLDRLRDLPAESVHCVVTSPPYYGLRDYKIEPQMWGGGRFGEHEWGDERELTMGRGDAGRPATMVPRGAGGEMIPSGYSAPQEKTKTGTGAFCRRCKAWRGSLGLEPTPDLYLDHMVDVCREIRRVLRRDGTLWLNIGDSYAGSWGAQSRRETPETLSRNQINNHPKAASHTGSIRAVGLKPKDLMLIPARLAIRLQDDGWWVRSGIAWCKRAPMPESCTDRPTSAWEHVFLLTKSGDSLFWTHRDHAGSRTKPAPDYRWVDHASEPAEYEGKWSEADDNSAGRRMLLSVRNARAAGADHDNPFGGDRVPLPETDVEPPNWRTEMLPDGKRKRWSRINLWAAHDYFYDAEAVKEEFADERLGNPGAYSKTSARSKGATRERQDLGFLNNGSGWNADGAITGRNLRNFWLLGPSPFPEAHFATFPPEIPRRAILAGTSERGVCPKCAAPWARVTETRQEATQATNNHGKASADNGWSGNTDRYPRTRRVDETLGWRATCSCDAGHPVPATILDPFLGAGTTALVADRLGRDCIGIELNPEYAAMARRRIAEDAGMFSPLQDAAE